MRILIRTSKWAIWSRRLGSFALPLTIVPVFLHRGGLIDSDVFAATEAAAIGFSILTVVLAGCALVQLWFSGDRGWGRAISGGLLGLLCLLPVGYLLLLGLRYPILGDISTDAADPPALTLAVAPQPAPVEIEALVHATYPNAQTRTYPLGIAEVYALVEDLVGGRGWEVRLDHGPAAAGDEGQLNAVAVTLLGWRDEVSIRVRGDAGGARVDVRSASLSAIHDPGSNGSRVEAFLLDLDEAVTVTLRDTSRTAPPVPEPAPAADAPPG